MTARQQHLDRVAELEARREAVIERVFAMQSRLRALKREIGRDGFAIVKRGSIGRRYLVGFNSYKTGRRKQVCVGAGGSWRQAFECATTTPFVSAQGGASANT